MTKNPFDPLFEEISQIMKFAYENVDKPISPEKEKELNKKLDELEKQVKAFGAKNEQVIENMGFSEFTINEIISDPDEQKKFDEEQIATLKKAESLKKEVSTATTDINRAAAESEARKQAEKPLKSSSPRARKGKFRGVGGDQKWKKL